MPSTTSPRGTVALHSPRIVSSGWGRVDAEGYTVPMRDAVLFPGGAMEWNWDATGTSHHEGIQPADVELLLAHGALDVVLSTGRLGLLRVPQPVIDLLEKRGARVHVLRTGPAIELYNELVATPDGVGVGALIHSTC